MMQDAEHRCGLTADTHKIAIKELIWDLTGLDCKIPNKTGGWGYIIDNANMELVMSADNNWKMIRRFV
ncbi:hypothetical protein D3C85_1816970 [compost metagenome]